MYKNITVSMCQHILEISGDFNETTKLAYNQTTNELILITKKTRVAFYIFRETTHQRIIYLGSISRLLNTGVTPDYQEIIDRKNNNKNLTKLEYRDLAEHLYQVIQSKNKES